MINLSSSTSILIVRTVKDFGNKGLSISELGKILKKSQRTLENLLPKILNENLCYKIKINDGDSKFYAPGSIIVLPILGESSPILKEPSPVIPPQEGKAKANILKKGKEKKERNFKIENFSGNAENILEQVPAGKMAEFSRLVNYVWKTLRCRLSENFSSDLIHRIAFALMSPEFGDITNEWVIKYRDEADAAIKATDGSKCDCRWKLITRRLMEVYEYHQWWYPSRRPERRHGNRHSRSRRKRPGTLATSRCRNSPPRKSTTCAGGVKQKKSLSKL